MAAKKVLFLTLKTFGFTGGIEKVCRTICRALYDLAVDHIVISKVYSMYDTSYDRDSRYLTTEQFTGFNENRKKFVLQSIVKGIFSDVVILSHVNLLTIGYLIKKISPKTKVYLIAHGIEIWRKLPEAKLRALKKFDKIIAVSEFTLQKISTIQGIEKEKLTVLNNCLDPFYYFPTDFSKPARLLKRYGLTEDHQIIFSLCRLSSSEKYKGYDNTIAILPKLIQNHPKLVYLIAGKPDEVEKIRLEKLIATHQLQDQVKLIGFVDEAEVTEHFLLSDIFILPSKKEGFGIVFIEAMASGLKVIGGRKDGSVDALKNGTLGKLVDPDDIDDIQTVLEKSLVETTTDETKIKLQQQVFEAFSYEKYREAIKNLILYGSVSSQTKFSDNTEQIILYKSELTTP